MPECAFCTAPLKTDRNVCSGCGAKLGYRVKGRIRPPGAELRRNVVLPAALLLVAVVPLVALPQSAHLALLAIVPLLAWLGLGLRRMLRGPQWWRRA